MEDKYIPGHLIQQALNENLDMPIGALYDLVKNTLQFHACNYEIEEAYFIIPVKNDGSITNFNGEILKLSVKIQVAIKG